MRRRELILTTHLRRAALPCCLVLLPMGCGAEEGAPSDTFNDGDGDGQSDDGSAGGEQGSGGYAGGVDCDYPLASCGAATCGVDLRSDAAHCGACGRSCLGSACRDGSCQEVTLNEPAGNFRSAAAGQDGRVFLLTSHGKQGAPFSTAMAYGDELDGEAVASFPTPDWFLEETRIKVELRASTNLLTFAWTGYNRKKGRVLAVRQNSGQNPVPIASARPEQNIYLGPAQPAGDDVYFIEYTDSNSSTHAERLIRVPFANAPGAHEEVLSWTGYHRYLDFDGRHLVYSRGLSALHAYDTQTGNDALIFDDGGNVQNGLGAHAGYVYLERSSEMLRINIASKTAESFQVADERDFSGRFAEEGTYQLIEQRLMHTPFTVGSTPTEIYRTDRKVRTFELTPRAVIFINVRSYNYVSVSRLRR